MQVKNQGVFHLKLSFKAFAEAERETRGISQTVKHISTQWVQEGASGRRSTTVQVNRQKFRLTWCKGGWSRRWLPTLFSAVWIWLPPHPGFKWFLLATVDIWFSSRSCWCISRLAGSSYTKLLSFSWRTDFSLVTTSGEKGEASQLETQDLDAGQLFLHPLKLTGSTSGIRHDVTTSQGRWERAPVGSKIC